MVWGSYRHVIHRSRGAQTRAANDLEVIPAGPRSVLLITLCRRPLATWLHLNLRTGRKKGLVEAVLDTLMSLSPLRARQNTHQVMTRHRRRRVAGAEGFTYHIHHNIHLSYYIQAARILFNSKNEQSALLSSHIDLHSLHVSEALEMLSELLPIYCHILYNTTTPPPVFNKLLYTRVISQCLPYVYIITGTGHHTKGQSGTGTNATSNVKGDSTVETKSRLFTAVDQYLSEWQLTYSVVADSNGYGGAFRISTGS